MARTKYKDTTNGNFMGIDNGVSGSIGIITPSGPIFFPTPVFMQQDYTKKKGNISRINTELLRRAIIKFGMPVKMALVERPMVNPTRFKATTSALRSLEATLIVLESLEIPFTYIDSKEWQKILLPKGVNGSSELKKASMDISCRLFPSCKETITKQKDGDGILIAEFCRRYYG